MNKLTEICRTHARTPGFESCCGDNIVDLCSIRLIFRRRRRRRQWHQHQHDVTIQRHRRRRRRGVMYVHARTGVGWKLITQQFVTASHTTRCAVWRFGWGTHMLNQKYTRFLIYDVHILLVSAEMKIWCHVIIVVSARVRYVAHCSDMIICVQAHRFHKFLARVFDKFLCICDCFAILFPPMRARVPLCITF